MADGLNTEDMLDVYLLENYQLLEKLQEIVLEQRDEKYFDEDFINEVFRTMHTIKASSAVMMFDEITLVSHKLEDIFSVLRETRSESIPHLQLIEHVLEVADFITNELQKIENGAFADGDASEIIIRLDGFLKEVQKESGMESEEKNIEKETVTQNFYIAPVRTVVQDGYGIQSEDMPIFIDLESSVEEIEARAERTREQIMKDAKNRDLVPGDFVIQAKEPGRATAFAKNLYKSSKKSAFMSVEVAKMDRLMNLIGELVNAQSVVLENPDLKVAGLSLDNFHKSADQMVKISAEVQNVIMSIRMVPLTNTFQKMNRIVFDLSRKLGKDIEFVMIGDTTEVDKNIVANISDSLMHLVRNAVDHGIETSEEKTAVGKTEHSKVTLSAKTESGEIWITVEDNGKGLDRDKIMNIARSQGLLDDRKPESAYTDKEVFQFITLPGFSTKEKISEYSGRGVGMDVVLSNVVSIGGNLEIESEKGKGSRMIIKIPITLAVW